MTEVALPQYYGGRAADPTTSGEFLDLRVSDDIPTNEYGIVVLDDPLVCVGESCSYQATTRGCFISNDHLHHSSTYYEYRGPLADEFRSEEALTRWVYRCVHDAKHNSFPHNVPLPRKKVMKKAIVEAKLLREVEANYRARTSQMASLDRQNLPRWSRTLVRRDLDRCMKDKKKLVKSVGNIEFLPQEIVAGALLLASPGHAEDRLIGHPHFMLPGTIRRGEVTVAWQAAQGMLQRLEERNRALTDAGQLDQDYLIAVAAAA